jgi:hypothetical protein
MEGEGKSKRISWRLEELYDFAQEGHVEWQGFVTHALQVRRVSHVPDDLEKYRKKTIQV